MGRSWAAQSLIVKEGPQGQSLVCFLLPLVENKVTQAVGNQAAVGEIHIEILGDVRVMSSHDVRAGRQQGGGGRFLPGVWR
jgi:hypothetical protein